MPATSSPLTLYSVIIPARDEEESLPATIEDIYRTFVAAGVPHEIVGEVGDADARRLWFRPAGRGANGCCILTTCPPLDLVADVNLILRRG